MTQTTFPKSFYIIFIVSLLFSCKNQSATNPETLVLSDWQFRMAGEEEWNKASVPGYAQSDLIEMGKLPDPYFRTNEDSLKWLENKDWEYVASININKEHLMHDQLTLSFEGLDTYADVYINDSLFIQADNMFLKWENDAKPWLIEGENTIRVFIHSPVKKGMEKLQKLDYFLEATSEQAPHDERTSIFTRKAPFHYGWDWGPRIIPSGIWRPVTLKAWSKAQISDVYNISQDISLEKATYISQIEINSLTETTAQVSVHIGETMAAEKTISLTEGLNKIEIPFQIEHPELWWTHNLGKPHLYDFTVLISDETGEIDKKNQKLGVRKIELAQEADSVGHSFMFKLNGVPVFMKGANYIPTDYFVANQTKKDYEKVLNNAVEANMNMLRVWGGAIYENDEFYTLCDEKGILIWQDFMFACALQPSDPEHIENIKKEAVYNVKRLRNHPAMALWCGNNENLVAWLDWNWKDFYDKETSDYIWQGYQTIFHEILDETVNQYTELSYWPTSPTTIDNKLADGKSGDEHSWKVYFGDQPFSYYEEHVPRFSSEYGMQAYPEINSLKKFTNEEDLSYRSEVLEHRQRSNMEWFSPGMNGSGMITHYIEKSFHPAEDFEDFVYLSQLNQAFALKTAAEAYRFNKPLNMGSLFWQINDCWPALSWSSIDYYGNWKASQYAIRHSYQDVLPIAQIKENIIQVNMVNDRLELIDGSLHLNIVDFEGNIIWQKEVEMTLEENISQLAFISPLADLIPEDQMKVAFLKMVFESDNQDLTVSNTKYFSLPKDQALPENPGLKNSVEQKEGRHFITISTEKLVRWVKLDFPGIEGHFSDNYFDLLPGEEKTVEFIPSNTGETLSELNITHL